MKSELKKDISEVLQLLAERDPAWAHPRMLTKFKWLFYAWAASEVRRKIRSDRFYQNSWQRGWMPIQDWRRFENYALQ